MKGALGKLALKRKKSSKKKDKREGQSDQSCLIFELSKTCLLYL